MKQPDWSNHGIRIDDLSVELNKRPLDLLESLKRAPTLKSQNKKKSNLDPLKVRYLLYNSGIKIKPQVFSFQMLKGGVAKTTSALNIGIRAAQYGLKVLLIDLDQQANLTYSLGCQSILAPVWIDIVEKKCDPSQAIIPIFETLDLIPSNLNNSVIEKVLIKSQRNWAMSVKGPLNLIRERYDWIIIDTAPSLTMLNTAVTCASDTVILPVSPDPFAMMGLEKHLIELDEIAKDFDLSHLNKKILFTQYDIREKLSQHYLDLCIEKYNELLLDSFIRKSLDVRKAIEENKTIFHSSSYAKEDYDLVTKELIGFKERLCQV